MEYLLWTASTVPQDSEPGLCPQGPLSPENTPVPGPYELGVCRTRRTLAALGTFSQQNKHFRYYPPSLPSLPALIFSLAQFLICYLISSFGSPIKSFLDRDI